MAPLPTITFHAASFNRTPRGLRAYLYQEAWGGMCFCYRCCCCRADPINCWICLSHTCHSPVPSSSTRTLLPEVPAVRKGNSCISCCLLQTDRVQRAGPGDSVCSESACRSQILALGSWLPSKPSLCSGRIFIPHHFLPSLESFRTLV